MDTSRRARLAFLLATRYKGDRARLIAESGLTKGRISQLLSSDPFGERAARDLEDKLGLPTRWFALQETQQDASRPSLPGGRPSNVEPAPDVKEGRGVPLISWIQAGDWGEAVEHFHPGDAEAWVPSLKAHSSSAFALRVRGDSMTAGHGRSYPEGCIIIVEPERRSPINGERIVAKLEGSNEVTFKVYKEEDGRRWLLPLNAGHEPIRAPFKVLGTVIGKWEDE
jgi:SOS-response transcriptional repressor LexA